jgi:hypothetical protein
MCSKIRMGAGAQVILARPYIDTGTVTRGFDDMALIDIRIVAIYKIMPDND